MEIKSYLCNKKMECMNSKSTYVSPDIVAISIDTTFVLSASSMSGRLFSLKSDIWEENDTVNVEPDSVSLLLWDDEEN